MTHLILSAIALMMSAAVALAHCGKLPPPPDPNPELTAYFAAKRQDEERRGWNYLYCEMAFRLRLEGKSDESKAYFWQSDRFAIHPTERCH